MKIDGTVYNGGGKESPYILNISFGKIRSEIMLNALSEEGIYVSSGSACASGKIGSHVLDAMNAQPLLHLGMRLGEGTGAICAYPIVQSAVNMINEMDNFQHAEITKYF